MFGSGVNSLDMSPTDKPGSRLATELVYNLSKEIGRRGRKTRAIS